MKHLHVPLSPEDVSELTAGERCLLTGTVLTARDAAHRRFAVCLKQNEPLPVSLSGQTLFYVGPTPPPPGHVAGAAGPTTSGRMDLWTPDLIEHCGLRAMIGKGPRSDSVVQAMRRYQAVYFAAVGGAGALLSKHIVNVKILCYEDLGTEAVRELTLEDFPVICAIDCHGGNLYEH